MHRSRRAASTRAALGTARRMRVGARDQRALLVATVVGGILTGLARAARRRRPPALGRRARSAIGLAGRAGSPALAPHRRAPTGCSAARCRRVRQRHRRSSWSSVLIAGRGDRAPVRSARRRRARRAGARAGGPGRQRRRDLVLARGRAGGHQPRGGAAALRRRRAQLARRGRRGRGGAVDRLEHDRPAGQHPDRGPDRRQRLAPAARSRSTCCMEAAPAGMDVRERRGGDVRRSRTWSRCTTCTSGP